MPDYQKIQKSITNPNVSYNDALDTNSPFSYLVFLKMVGGASNGIVDFYNHYINSWNSIKQKSSTNSNSEIIERYRDFLRDISLNYTTEEEKKFLSKIDFNDPIDLEIAIPFYSKKIYEISNFYNLKREESKFEITNQKLKGTASGLVKNIKKWVVSYAENLPDGKININIENLKNNIDIEIEELYDDGGYYNQTPDTQIFDRTDLDYGLDIFLRNNSDMITELFSGINENLVELKEYNSLFDNKRELTKQNIYSNFYYLSTGNTKYDVLSGLLFESKSPVFNFFNRDYPTYAFTEHGRLKTPTEMGFFKPHKRGCVVIDGKNSSYSINFEKLSSGGLFYLPDPDIVASNNEYLTFISDDSALKRNYSSGIAKDEPNSKSFDTKFYGYSSKIDPTSNKYLDGVSDMGYISNYQQDINGNLFALVKNSSNFSKDIKIDNRTSTLYYQILDGYKFFDDLFGEGYNFNYETIDYTTYPNTFRTGLSGGNFGTFDPVFDFTITFGDFSENSVFQSSQSSTTYYAISGLCKTSLIESLPEYGDNSIIYIKNIHNNTISSLLSEMSFLTSRYNATITSQLTSNISDFEIIGNSIFIQTDNYLIIDKINFNSGVFEKPETSPFNLNFYETSYQPISNRIKIEDEVFFAKIVLDSIVNKNLIYHVEVYKHNTTTSKTDKIYPITTPDYFTIDIDSKLIKIDTPILKYTNRNKIFSLVLLLKDQNDYPVLNTIDFTYQTNISFEKYTTTLLSNNSTSLIFDNISSINWVLSSGTPTVENEEIKL